MKKASKDKKQKQTYVKQLPSAHIRIFKASTHTGSLDNTYLGRAKEMLNELFSKSLYAIIGILKLPLKLGSEISTFRVKMIHVKTLSLYQ